MTTEMPSARVHLAWLMWCFEEGYTKAEDRAILTNWLLRRNSSMHPNDIELRDNLLAMADEILAALEAERG